MKRVNRMILLVSGIVGYDVKYVACTPCIHGAICLLASDIW